MALRIWFNLSKPRKFKSGELRVLPLLGLLLKSSYPKSCIKEMDVHTPGAWRFPSLIYWSSTEVEILHFYYFNIRSDFTQLWLWRQPVCPWCWTWEIIKPHLQKFIGNQDWWSSEQPGLVEGGIGWPLRSTPTQNHYRIVPESTIPQSCLGLGSRRSSFKHDITWKSLHRVQTPKTSVMIHEEFGLFTEPLFAASAPWVFIGVETNLRGVVVSGWVIPKDPSFDLKVGLDLCRACPPPPAPLITTSILFLRPRRALISHLPEIYLSALSAPKFSSALQLILPGIHDK